MVSCFSHTNGQSHVIVFVINKAGMQAAIGKILSLYFDGAINPSTAKFMRDRVWELYKGE